MRHLCYWDVPGLPFPGYRQCACPELTSHEGSAIDNEGEA